MPLEASVERITLNSRGNGENIQLLTEGDMIVPDINPDIYQILKADEDIIIDTVKAGQGRVSFSGRLCVTVLYCGKKTEQPVSFMKAEFPIEDYIMSDGITEESDTDIMTEIIHSDYRLVNDRKINVRAVSRIAASWTNSDSIDAVKGAEGDSGLQLKTGIVYPGSINERITEEFTVREEMRLPAGKPDIAEILETTAEVCHRDIRCTDGAVQMKGDLKICIVYIGADEHNTIDSAEFFVPFNGSTDVPGMGGDMICMARIKPISVKAETEADDSGAPRAVSAEVTVGAVMKVFGRSEEKILEDAYSLSCPIELTKKDASYIELYGRNRAQSTFRGGITTEGKPPMMQIIKCWGSIRNMRSSVQDGMVRAEGTADVKLMYIAKDDRMPLAVAESAIPFSQDIEIRGADDSAGLDITAELEDISFSMLSENEAEVRAVISVDAVACGNRNCGIIIGITEGESSGEPIKGGAVIYTVKKGDTLWNIAKKYHTTVDDIVRINKIENPDLIYPGQRFLIFKKFV